MYIHVHAGYRIIGEIKEMLQADLIAYSASISACARGGQWQLALQLMAEMKAVEVRPNVVSSLGEMSIKRGKGKLGMLW